jgi:hypothetical protein
MAGCRSPSRQKEHVMRHLALLLSVLFVSALSVNAWAYNACADINNDSRVNLVDLTKMVFEHASCWGGALPMPPDKGDIDGRAGYNLGDQRFLMSYLWGYGGEGSCPPFPAYNIVTTDDVLYMPKVLFGSVSGSGTLALPIVWTHAGWISDFLLPFSFTGLSPNVVFDSIAAGSCLDAPNGRLFRKALHLPDGYLDWSCGYTGEFLAPGTDTIAAIYIHYLPAPGESLAVNAVTLGPHTFLSYVTAPTATENCAEMTIAIPRVRNAWTTPEFSALMRPDPQYVYFQFAIDPIIDTVYFGDLPDGHVAADVNLSTVQIGSILPASVFVHPAVDGLTGDVVGATFPAASFLAPLGALYDETLHLFTVSWQYQNGTPASMDGVVRVMGKSSLNPSQYLTPPDVAVLPGDANLDGAIDVGDVVAMIQYVFSGGPVPERLPNGDVDCSNTMDISDAVYLVQYIFSSGPGPCLMP